MSYSHKQQQGNVWTLLGGCTAGRPIDPGGDPQHHYHNNKNSFFRDPSRHSLLSDDYDRRIVESNTQKKYSSKGRLLGSSTDYKGNTTSCRLPLDQLYARQQLPPHYPKTARINSSYVQLSSPTSSAAIRKSRSCFSQLHRQRQPQDNEMREYFDNPLDNSTDTTSTSTATSSNHRIKRHRSPPQYQQQQKERQELCYVERAAQFSPAIRAALMASPSANRKQQRWNGRPSRLEPQQLLANTQCSQSSVNSNDGDDIHPVSAIQDLPSLVETASLVTGSHSGELSFPLSFVEDKQEMQDQSAVSTLTLDHSVTSPGKLQEQQQLQQDESLYRDLSYCRQSASRFLERYGMNHVVTAHAFLDLGQAQIQVQDFSAAQEACRSALRVFERKFGSNDLHVAKALELLAMAQTGYGMKQHSSTTSTNSVNDIFNSFSSAPNEPSKARLLLGLQSLRKCFHIRYQALGPTHIDTVETVNKIANIYMALGMYSSAIKDFMEVMQLRAAIFGDYHPSVAIAARAMGQVFLKQELTSEAKTYLLKALNIFAMAGLPEHPAAVQLRDDVTALGFDLARVEI